MKNYSVITVTLNSAKTLQQTINSVLCQSPLPYEYIFIDGGSNDNTFEIINSMNFKAHGIKLILEKQKEKNGIYGAINQGIKLATGDIIFVLHSDDWLEPEAAKTVLAKFAEEPDCDVILSSAYMHYKDGKSHLKHQRSFNLFPILMPLIHPATFARKLAYDKYGLYDESFSISSDYDFFYRLYKIGIKFCEIRKPLVNVRLGGYANTHRKKARKETLKIALKYSRFYLLPYVAYIARVLSGR